MTVDTLYTPLSSSQETGLSDGRPSPTSSEPIDWKLYLVQERCWSSLASLVHKGMVHDKGEPKIVSVA